MIALQLVEAPRVQRAPGDSRRAPTALLLSHIVGPSRSLRDLPKAQG